jgi:hypothetical protein
MIKSQAEQPNHPNSFKMKAIIISLSLAIICITFYSDIIIPFYIVTYQTFKEKALSYDKNCLFTSKLSCHLNEAVLNEKIKKGLPLWAKVQIKEDLSKFKKIKKSDLSKSLNDLNVFSPARVEIKNKHAEITFKHHFPTLERYVYPRHVRKILPEVLEFLASKGYIKDTIFFIELSDYVNGRKPYQKPTIPIFTFAKDLSVPLENDAILMPDWMNFESRAHLSKSIKNANKMHAYDNKQAKLFWRGATKDSTGFREKLVALSHLQPKLIDAKFAEPGDNQFTKPADHLKYKYLISIDGVRASWERFVWHLSSNSLVFKHDTSQVQWFYKGISANVHYVPIFDEKSLLNKIAWADKNPEKVKAIIQNANNFAENNLELEDMCHYLIVLLEEYTKRIDDGS